MKEVLQDVEKNTKYDTRYGLKISVALGSRIQDRRTSQTMGRFTKTFKDIIIFHTQFDNIQPYQDGNGRIGRFIMLKQCVENDMDLILIDDQYSKEYKKAFYIAQSKEDYTMLNNVFKNVSIY